MCIMQKCFKAYELMSSHIIPEFLYKTMYDQKHRFREISTLKDKDKFHQKGIKEKLLCTQCEAKFSAYERYASLVLNGGIELNMLGHKGYVLVTELDYEKFKLFQLSILWRASISEHPLFKEVKLETSDESKIREMLILEKPGDTNAYGCIIAAITFIENPLTDVILQPEKIKIYGHPAYRFVFGGFIWIFSTSVFTQPNELSDSFLNSENQLKVYLKDAEKYQPLVEIAQKVYIKKTNLNKKPL